MGGERILIIDDEPPIRKFLRVALEAQGYEVEEAATGRQGIRTAATAAPDVIIIDLGLPDMDGKDVVASVREWSQLPILVLSVRDQEGEKIGALDCGANDYVTKPFGVGELLARLRALLRASSSQFGDEAGPKLVRGPLSIDLAAHLVTLDDRPIQLTRREYELLVLLARHAGRLLTHKQLLHEIWGPAHEQDAQYLRVFIGRLRQKLGDDPAAPKFIVTEPGVGYRFAQF
ncbi:MAG: response regulator transcription factor [Alphaproteobacteria bacterium]|nr:response regulator transcription factor [Alphaproteobacteria bacterium]